MKQVNLEDEIRFNTTDVNAETFEWLLKFAEALSATFEKTIADCNVKVIKSRADKMILVRGKWFILAVLDPELNDDNRMTLMLETSINSYLAAITVKLISGFVESAFWKLGREYYYDPEERKMYFEDTARQKKTEKLMQRRGVAKCCVCDEHFAIRHINKQGMCTECEEIYPAIKWC